MNSSKAVLLALALCWLLMCLGGCNSDCELRGCISQSTDGKTYLIVDDDNGGGCGPIRVDGYVWPHKIGEAGEIKPGVHTIECGGEIRFNVGDGVVFRFNYWGP